MKKVWLDLIYLVLACVIFFLGVSPSGASGEAAADPADNRIVGWRVGPFTFLPHLSLNGAYDSNIYATNDQLISDRFLVLTPSLSVQSTGTPHKLLLSTGAQMTRFDENTTEDSNDYWVNADGRYDLADGSNLFGGFAFSLDHEERASPDDANGLEPTTYSSKGLHLGTEFGAQRFGTRLGGNVQQLNFDDVSTLTSIINNADRDRILYGYGLRVSYTPQGEFSPFVQLIFDQRRYADRLDDNGFRRDSKGYRAAVGFRSKQPHLSSEVYAGFLWQDYDDPGFSTTGAVDIGATIDWSPLSGTRIALKLEREVNETTLAGSSGYLETAGVLSCRQLLTARSTLQIGARFSEDEYQGIARKDYLLSGDLGFRYTLFKSFYIGAEYHIYRLDSRTDKITSPENNDYDRQQLFLTLGAKI